MAYYQDLASTPAPADTPGGASGPQPQEGEEPSRTRQEESRYFTATVRPGKEAEQAEAELGKHWTNAEVQALLHTWAERREELRGAARNKSIFLEMSRQLQQLGVERSWKQCRTKYKNLRYDYKSARNSHTTPNSDAKHMRFYSQVDAIEQGRDLGSTWRGPERDQATPMNQGDTTPLGGNSDWRPGGGADMGRNWQDEEVRALIAIWGEEPVRQRLESAARNRDVFQHISLRLRLLGVERDWKQCRTKYKNLKYISRSLQRTPPSHAHPTPSFYREVDAILSKGTMAQAPPTHLPKGEPEQRSTPITCTENSDSGTERTKESRGLKREASDGEWSVPSKRVLHKQDEEDTSVSCSAPETVHFQGKEEPGQYIPIVQINSVHSTDPPGPQAQKQASNTQRWQNNLRSGGSNNAEKHAAIPLTQYCDNAVGPQGQRQIISTVCSEI